MNKLYYTDILKALWMIREFSVKLGLNDDHGLNGICCNEEGNYCDYSQEITDSTRLWDGDTKFMVLPSCYNIFEPQFGDLVRGTFWVSNTVSVLNESTDFFAWRTRFFVLTDEREMDSLKEAKYVKIIQHHGKAFFSPEIEVTND